MLTFVLQVPLAVLCSRVTGFWRVVVMDIFNAVAFVGSVNVWRGLWILYDIYLLPGALTEHVANGCDLIVKPQNFFWKIRSFFTD